VKGNGDFSIGSQVWPGVSKLIEEMGELQQVLGKLVGAEGETETKHWDGTHLRARLVEEIADVRAALAFFQVKNLTERDIMDADRRCQKKFEIFMEWHRDQELKGGGM
jgi:hypothetical protein